MDIKMVMKIGITGTREGMNENQACRVYKFLSQYPPGTEFHHGDCVGVDAQAAKLAKLLGFKIISHPGPDKDGLRAYFESDVILEPETHFKRNRNIVDTCDILLVVPLQNQWQPRGGTWYTHDYAIKQNKPIEIYLPLK